MATLMEKLAAKKAAALEASTAPVKEEPAPLPASTTEEPAKAEEKAVEEKPLSFAEKMALKKAQQASTNNAAQIAAAPVTEKKEEEKKPVPEAVVIGIVSHVAEEEDHQASIAAASPEDQQAYADIKAKISMLANMSEVELKGAMTDLKKSLLQNPQACYLMLPRDIGEMVIALRTMKNETIEAAAKTPKEKKAKASKALTADEIAAAFDSI